MSQDQRQAFKITEKTLPGRMDTRALGNYKGKRGWMCTDCKEVVNHPMLPCSCPAWQDAMERRTKNV